MAPELTSAGSDDPAGGDGWAGMVERRMSPGGHGNSGKTRANHGSGSQVLHTGTSDFEDGSGAGMVAFKLERLAHKLKSYASTYFETQIHTVSAKK